MFFVKGSGGRGSSRTVGGYRALTVFNRVFNVSSSMFVLQNWLLRESVFEGLTFLITYMERPGRPCKVSTG